MRLRRSFLVAFYGSADVAQISARATRRNTIYKVANALEIKFDLARARLRLFLCPAAPLLAFPPLDHDVQNESGPCARGNNVLYRTDYSTLNRVFGRNVALTLAFVAVGPR